MYFLSHIYLKTSGKTIPHLTKMVNYKHVPYVTHLQGWELCRIWSQTIKVSEVALEAIGSNIYMKGPVVHTPLDMSCLR